MTDQERKLKTDEYHGLMVQLKDMQAIHMQDGVITPQELEQENELARQVTKLKKELMES
jgi:hypothetical protein